MTDPTPSTSVESPHTGETTLWCVHVRGPDDLVPVASYDDAVRLADGLNWWWCAQHLTENDPWISAVPALWDGKPEIHAQHLARLGTKGSDYGMPTEEQVEAKRVAAFKRLCEPPPTVSAGGSAPYTGETFDPTKEVEPVELAEGVNPEDLSRAVRQAVDNAYAKAGGRYDNSVRVSLPAAFVDWLLQNVNIPPAVPAGSDRPQADAAVAEAFQARVQPWLMACFGPEISGDREERNHRFLEEALELVQSCGCTASEAHQLVDYTFARDVGEPHQETGGVMVTLAALCLANGLDMHQAAEVELARIWTKVEKIRARQAAKPKHSPLPVVKEETENPCADVLRGLASYLGVGGYNAETVDPAVFDRKIRDGIDMLTAPLQREAERYWLLRNRGAAPGGTLHLKEGLVFVGTNLDRFLDCALAGKPVAPSHAVEMDPTQWPEIDASPAAALHAAQPMDRDGWREQAAAIARAQREHIVGRTPWDEGMRDMSVRIERTFLKSALPAPIAAAPAPGREDEDGAVAWVENMARRHSRSGYVNERILSGEALSASNDRDLARLINLARIGARRKPTRLEGGVTQEQIEAAAFALEIAGCGSAPQWDDRDKLYWWNNHADKESARFKARAALEAAASAAPSDAGGKDGRS